MKTRSKLTRLVAMALTLMMVIVMSVPQAFALSDKWDGSSTLAVKASASDRQFTAYQIFQASSYSVDDGTLGDITWGASVENYTTELLAALVAAKDSNSTLPDGSAVPAELRTVLESITTASTAAQVAEALSQISEKNDSVATEAFVAIVESVVAVSSNTEKKELTLSSGETLGNNHEYLLQNVSDGYYLVIETTDANTNSGRTYSRNMLRLVGNSEISIKTTDGPPFVKTTNGTDAAGVSAGDTVSFNLGSTVPSDIAKYTSGYYFIATDTMSKGLEYVEDSMKITVGTEEVTVYTTTPTNPESEKYAILTETDNSDGSTTLKIVFHKFNQYAAGSAVSIDYSAKVTSDITNGESAGANNDASLTYSNSPDWDYGGEDEPDDGDPVGTVTTTEDSSVYLYSTTITLNKVNAAGIRLTGAEFTISGTSMTQSDVMERTFTRELSPASNTDYYYKNSSGEMIKINSDDVANSSAQKVKYTYVKASASDTYVQTSEDADNAEYYQYTAYTGSDTEYNADGGYLKITTYNSMDDTEKGYFTFVTGYAPYTLTENETAEIFNNTTVSSSKAVAANGSLTFTDLGVGTYTIRETKAPEGYSVLAYPIYVTVAFSKDSSGNAVWTYTIECDTNEDGNGSYSATYVSTNTGAHIDGNGGLVFDLKNAKGTSSSLPQTGGIGTTIFYVVGGILVVGAGVLLIVKRRMSAEEN